MKNTIVFSEKGISGEKLSGRLSKLKQHDARWEQGKTFGFVYHPGEHEAEVSEAFRAAFLLSQQISC